MKTSEILLSLLGSLLYSCVLLMIPITATMLREGFPLKKNLDTILLFPAFMSLSFVFGFVSFFNTVIQWKPIPHIDTTSIEQLEGPTSQSH